MWDHARFVARVKEKWSLETPNCGCDVIGWNMEYTSFLTALERYRIANPHTCEFCGIGRGVFEDGVHVIGRLAPRTLHTHIWSHVNLLRKLAPTACWHGLQKLCKIASGVIKLGAARISPAWRYIAYWETFFGYVPYKPLSALEDEARTWLGTFLRLGGPLGEDQYLEMLFEEATKFIQYEWSVPEDLLTPEEWCKSGRWMEGKAGTGKKMDVTIGQKRHRTRRMKPLEGVFSSDQSIATELKVACREEMFIMQKSEGGKIRPVVKTGNCLNRKMNYLSDSIERGFFGSELSTLFAGERGNEKIDLDLISAVRDDQDWCVPLDQGGFDQHQSKKSIMVVLASLFFHILPLINRKDIAEVAAALWDSLNNLGASAILGKDSWEWVNGLPSGWRWTAMLDTILNISSFRVVQKLASQISGRAVGIRHFYAQGDDVIFTCSDLSHIRWIIHIYGEIGYEVHPQKTFISRHRAEFLRRSYEPWGITGYAARTISGLRFRNPIQEVPLSKGERLYSRLVQWHLASIRGCRTSEVASMLMEDCVQMGLDADKCGAYFLTPSALGGGGARSAVQPG